MKYDDDFIHKYYSQFLSSENHEDLSSKSEYESVKRRVFHHKQNSLDLLLNKSNIFKWQVSLLFFSQRQEIIITYGSD